ncbi:MAG TPA: hypothetical protein VF843_16300 [Streptosporangiaceae bacterium]
MRKSLSLAAVAAAATSAVLALPATSAFAAGHVLTITKTGGTAVKVGAVLKSGLAKGKTATFSLGTEKLTCKSASFTAKVTANPAKPGTATESLTAQSFAKCTVNVTGVTVKSIKVNNLPYKVSVSDASGHPVAITGSSSSKPVKVTVNVALGTTNVTCSYTATTVKGTSSNTGSTITFSKQKFAKSSGALCPAAATFSAVFGPVKDTSVTGSPAVFVN